MLIADQANKSLHEAGVVGRIVMTAARRAEIFVRDNARVRRQRAYVGTGICK
jgi:hypothetical protein